MNYRISRRADADLDAIWDFIARDNPKAADRVEADFRTAMRRLAEFPALGHRRPEAKYPPYRFLLVHSYLIAYRVQGKTVIIVRVIHSARDLSRIFKRKK